jgi:hypothetical protein
MERSVGASADLIHEEMIRAREQYLYQWRGVISFITESGCRNKSFQEVAEKREEAGLESGH